MVKPLSAKKYQPKNIPPALVRDVIDGKEFYYRGYREVLDKTKTIEEIMATSTLQAEIIMYLNYLLTQALGIKKYKIYTSESGLHIAKKINYSLDLAVYDSAILTAKKIDEHYASVVPFLVVEVDVKVDTDNLSEWEFIELKTKSLLKHGAKKVVWVTSKNKQILIAEPEKKWTKQSWEKPFELMNGVIADVGGYLKEAGVPAAQ